LELCHPLHRCTSQIKNIRGAAYDQVDPKCRCYHRAKRAPSDAVILLYITLHTLPYSILHCTGMKSYRHEVRSCAHENDKKRILCVCIVVFSFSPNKYLLTAPVYPQIYKTCKPWNYSLISPINQSKYSVFELTGIFMMQGTA